MLLKINYFRQKKQKVATLISYASRSHFSADYRIIPTTVKRYFTERRIAAQCQSMLVYYELSLKLYYSLSNNLPRHQGNAKEQITTSPGGVYTSDKESGRCGLVVRPGACVACIRVLIKEACFH